MPSTGTTELVVTEIQKSKPIISLTAMFRIENSIIDFDKAIELDGRNPIIYSNRGLVNRKMERYEEAIQDYNNEIKFGL
jgi:tetratricopeptide (TPR) repeat protein